MQVEVCRDLAASDASLNATGFGRIPVAWRSWQASVSLENLAASNANLDAKGFGRIPMAWQL